MGRKGFILNLIFKVTVILCSHITKPHLIYKDASSFMENFNKEASKFCNRDNVATWNLYMDFSKENKELQAKVAGEQKMFLVNSSIQAASFPRKLISDRFLRRQFEILDRVYKVKLPPGKAEKLLRTSEELQTAYNTAKLCPYGKEGEKSGRGDNCKMTIQDMVPILETSTNIKELLHYWKKWRDVTGNRMRDTYLRFVELSNEEARLNGFADVGENWRSHYETRDFPGVLQGLLDKIRPLYQQLHAYVRRKLIEIYGKERIRKNGPLPEHLLAYNWVNLQTFATPHPNKPRMDIMPIVEERHLTAVDMVRMADDFFQSLGFEPMNDEFWKNSVFTKIQNRSMVCHAQAFDFCDGKDFRIRMCIRKTMDRLIVIHHEMGHIQYGMMYAYLPYILRDGANDGFHEAIGDTIGLSLSTPSHWKSLGFMDRTLKDDPEQDINALFSVALHRLPILPYTFAIEKWRWGLFNGSINSDNANTKWWEYSLENMGICPPIRRTEKSLDAAQLFQVAIHSSVDRYFVSDILQFQFYKALCDASGHKGPLHKCDIYGSTVAGARLRDMMSLGRSKPWPEALMAITGGKTGRLDAQPLLDYFQPLYLWLKEQNRGEVIGWSSKDPTVCP